MSFLSIPLFWGRLNLKWASDSLFSERYGYVPTIQIGPFRVTWRLYRGFDPASPAQPENAKDAQMLERGWPPEE